MHEFLKDLDKANFGTIGMVEEKLHTLPTPSLSVSTTEFLGVSTRIGTLEREMFKPDRLVALLCKRVKIREERRANNAIECGNHIFKDQQAVDAFVVLTGDKDLYRYCIDFVSLFNLAPDLFFTVSEGMASEAAAVKANFNSLLEAWIALSHHITYHENLMRRSKKTG